MKAPTSLLILPPELLINPLPPSLLSSYTPLHFFTLTLLYPYTSLPLHSFNSFNPINSFNPVNSFKRLVSSNLVRVVRLVHLSHASRLCCSSRLCCPSPVCAVPPNPRCVSCASHPMRLFVSFHLARLLCVCLMRSTQCVCSSRFVLLVSVYITP